MRPERTLAIRHAAAYSAHSLGTRKPSMQASAKADICGTLEDLSDKLGESPKVLKVGAHADLIDVAAGEASPVDFLADHLS